MIKIHHNTIEYEGNIIADMRSNVLEFTRCEIRDKIEFALLTDRQWQDGELIEREEYQKLEDEVKNLKSKHGDIKQEVNALRNQLGQILESLGPKTNKKFDNFYANLQYFIETIDD